MKGFSAFLDRRRCKDGDHEISSRKYLSKDAFHQFPEHSVSLHPELPSEGASSCSSTGFSKPQRGMPSAFGKHRQSVADTVST